MRLHEKYLKAIKDAETTIRQRYVSLDMEKKAALGKEKEKVQRDPPTKDENFVKSFSKVIYFLFVLCLFILFLFLFVCIFWLVRIGYDKVHNISDD